MRIKELGPDVEATGMAVQFVEDALIAGGCPMPATAKLCIAVDELFSNIALYSGASRARISCDFCGGVAALCIMDDGKPFNPTDAQPPDIAIPLSQRDIGGLGIHMARTFMDEIKYERKDGWNVLTIKKKA